MQENDDKKVFRDAAAYVRWIESLGFVVPQSCLEGIERPAAPPTTQRNPSASPEPALMPPRAATPRAPAKINAQTATPDLVLKGPPDSDKRAQLAQLFETVSVCTKCALGSQRTQAVFGVGNYDADLMFIGEAPGANEDRMGIPFVGNAGKLLTQELEKNNIPRDDVFIANILKCRPPENRDPLPGEIEQCSPYLLQQIDIIKPKLLCGLGRFACGLLMKQQIPIMKLRGTWSQYHGLPLFICLHPSAILHNPNNRELFIQDIAQLAKTYHEKRQ